MKKSIIIFIIYLPKIVSFGKTSVMNIAIFSSALFVILYTFMMRKKHVLTNTILFVLDEEPNDLDSVIRLVQPTWMYMCDFAALASFFCVVYFMIMQYGWWAILGIPINFLIVPQLTKIAIPLDKYFLRGISKKVEKKYEQLDELDYHETKYILKFEEWIIYNKQTEIFNELHKIRKNLRKKDSY